jgi:WD40 repeat protein
MRDLVADGRRRQMEVWDVSRAQRILLFPRTPWNAVSFHPRLPRIIIGREDAAAVTWNLETGEEISRFRLASEPNLLRFSPDGERVAAAHAFGRGWMITVHQARDGAPQAAGAFADHLADLDWHPDGRWIATPDRGGTVHLMDSRTGETRALGRHKTDAVTTVFSPDGEYLLSGGWDRELICWDVKAMQRAFTIGLDSYRLQFSSDGQQCAVLRRPELRLQLHAFERPALCREFTEDLGVRLNHAAFSSDGRWLAASSGEGMCVWDLHNTHAAALVKEASDTRLSFSGSGELFANRRGRCFRWRVSPGTNGAAPELDQVEMANPAGFVSLCLVSNGVVLTSARGSKLAGFDELATDPGAWGPTVDGLNGVSPDGQWLGVFRSFTPQVHIHRLPGMERVAKLTSEASVSRFEFSPQGNEIAVASRGGVEFWSTATWQRTRQIRNYNAILYSPDGRTFWLGSDLRAAALHDARTAEPLLPLPRGARPLAVSRDGRHLAVSVNARRLQVWDLAEVRQYLRVLGLDWADAAR